MQHLNLKMMKNLISAFFLMAILSLFAANDATAQYINGAWEGSGKMQGITCPVKFRFEPSGVAVTYGGICNCVALLQETGTKMLFRETDFLSADGGTRNDSCRSREYVFFTQKDNDITANWGDTPEEAMADKSPFLLLKIK